MMKMDKAARAAMLMSSLSVYSGVLGRTVAKAFYRLLCARNSPPKEFLEAWSDFFRLLCERGYSETFAQCLSEAAKFDENVFSRAAAAGRESELTESEKNAVKRDISAIIYLSTVTPEDIIRGYAYREEIAGIGELLPRWKTGRPAEEFSDEETAAEKLAAYYKSHGCGMFARYRAFIWRERSIEPVVYPDDISLSSLKGYDYQRGLVVENTTSFLSGAQCNNCLLYGDRGTGKSSTVKAILNRYYADGLRMVELPKDRLGEFSMLVEKIAPLPLKFIIFIDDLSFGDGDRSYAQLKAVLEGGLAVRPRNTLIYATSNRRHLIKENFSDREGDDLHRNDTMQETLSLSDRFGLSVGFSKPDKETYLMIVRSLALERNIDKDPEALVREAEKWALLRGGRSPRCARQFIAALEAGIDF